MDLLACCSYTFAPSPIQLLYRCRFPQLELPAHSAIHRRLYTRSRPLSPPPPSPSDGTSEHRATFPSPSPTISGRSHSFIQLAGAHPILPLATQAHDRNHPIDAFASRIFRHLSRAQQQLRFPTNTHRHSDQVRLSREYVPRCRALTDRRSSLSLP